jgi:NOL1/NOP2/sun family putative RNA methylase
MDVRELAKKYGYRQETVKKYFELFEGEVENLLRANDVDPYVALRTNSLKIRNDDLQKRLEEKGVELERVESGFVVKKAPFSLASSPEYLLGFFYIQGVAEMSVAPLLAPHGYVWDMCAAPGGKTTHLAALMENGGVLVATDVAKIRALKANTQRLGVMNTIIYDMSALDMKYRFDCILLDAPCTGSGIIRKDPTRKYSRTQSDVDFCQRLQKDLLRAAYRNLKNGGMLLYSTCSLEPEEDEEIVFWATRHFHLTLHKVGGTVWGIPFQQGFSSALGKEYGREMKKCVRTFPHIHNTNGMFAALFKKT